MSVEKTSTKKSITKSVPTPARQWEPAQTRTANGAGGGMAIRVLSRSLLSIRAELRRALKSECVQLVRDPESGAFALRSCGENVPGRIKITTVGFVSCSYLVHTLALKQGDILPVHEENGVFVISLPVAAASEVRA